MTTTDADRSQLVAYLVDHGATHGFLLREAMGWGLDRFWDAVYGPGNGWFSLGTYGWDLTDRGRREGPAGG